MIPEDQQRERLLAGDLDALATLFDECRPRLLRMVDMRLDRRMRGRVDPEDVIQETYLAAVQRLDSYAKQEDLGPYLWIRLLTLQTLTDVHRRHMGAKMRRADQEVSLFRGLPTASSRALSRQFLASFTSPSQAILKEEARTLLIESLDAMDPVDREVLLLRHFEELSNNEVAQLLGLKKSAASNRYIRALTRLKTILEREDRHT